MSSCSCRDLTAALHDFNRGFEAGAPAESAALPAMLRATQLLLTEPADRARRLASNNRGGTGRRKRKGKVRDSTNLLFRWTATNLISQGKKPAKDGSNNRRNERGRGKVSNIAKMKVFLSRK